MKKKVTKSKAKKKPTVKRRAKLKLIAKNGGYESSNWSSSNPTLLRPAWCVNYQRCHMDLDERGSLEVRLTAKSNPKLIAHYINKLVNEYYVKGVNMLTNAQTDEILNKVKVFVQKTDDMLEKI